MTPLTLKIPALAQMLGELAALCERHRNLAVDHARTALQVQDQLKHLESPLPERGELYDAGARILAAQAAQIVAKANCVAVLYSESAPFSRMSVDPGANLVREERRATKASSAIWLPLHPSDSEGGLAD